MNTVIYFLLGVGYLVLLLWGIILAKKQKHFRLSTILLLVIVGLIYDNLIIALGRYIGEGQLLENLSYPRYWLHALFTPTLVLFAWAICVETRIPWAKGTFVKAAAVLLTLGLICYELLTSVNGLALTPKWENDVLTYENSSQSTNGVMVMIITIVLIGVGFILFRKLHFPWLFVGTFVMVFGSSLAIWFKEFPMMNILEFILMISLVLTYAFGMIRLGLETKKNKHVF